MTLNTRIYVLDQIRHRDAFTKLAQLLGVTEETRIEDRQDPSWRLGERIVEPGNPWTIETVPGQGLPAWLMVHYRPDAPYRSEAEAAEHDEDICNLPDREWYDADEGPCDGSDHAPACWLEISLDTGYGYRGENDEGCGDLHAKLIAQFGSWLREHNIRWKWLNEFTGKVFDGFAGLETLGSSGHEANAWFTAEVAPLIARMEQ